MECEKRPTEGQRRHLKENIVSTIAGFNFHLTNPDAVRSRRDYNKYVVDFPTVFGVSTLKQYLIVETSVFLRAYPNKQMTASSFIYDYLKKEKREDIIKQFAIIIWIIRLQNIQGTFMICINCLM